jgi:hypothetical protein
MEKKSKRTTSVKKTKAARKQVAAPAAISVTTKGMVPAVRTEGTDIVVTHEELFAIVEGASIAVGIGSTTNGANVHNYLINPTETSVFPWLAAIADRYEKYRVEDLEIAYVPMVGTATRGQVVLSVDFDPADEMSTEPTMDTRMMLTSKPDSISMPVWQLGTLRCAQPRLKRVGERFVRNWAGEQEIIGPISRTSDMGVLSIGLFNVDESLSHVVYGDLRVRYRIRLMTPQLQLPEAEQPSEGSIELANPGGLSPKFDLKTGELSASGFATATTWRAGPYIIEPLLATQLYTTAVGATPHAMVRLKEDCEGRLTLRGQVRAFTAFTSDLVSFLPSWAAFFTPQNVGGVVRLPAVPMAMADEMDRYYYGNSAFDGTITRSAMSDLFKIKQRYEVSNVTSTSTHFDLVLELVGRFVKGTVLHFLCNPTIWMGTYSASALELTNLKMAMTPRASLSKNYINTALAVHTVRADPKTGVPRLTTEPVVGSTTPVNRSIVYN